MQIDQWLPHLITALAPLLIALLSWGFAELARLIRARVRNEYARGALERLNDAVSTVVKEQTQTTIADLKEAASDGKITKLEAIEIRDKAAARIRTYLGTKAVKDLEGVFDRDMIEEIIKAKIEAAIHDMKALPAAPPATQKGEGEA